LIDLKKRRRNIWRIFVISHGPFAMMPSSFLPTDINCNHANK